MSEFRQYPIDLRGEYRPEGRPEFVVESPADLVANGIRVSESAIVATPTWGEEAVEEYREAIVLIEAEN